MNNQTAIDAIVTETCSGCYGSDEEPHRCDTCAYKMAITVLERNIPKEVTPYASAGDPSSMDIIDCPSCGETYFSEDWGTFNFCPNCGQAIKVKEEVS